MTHVGNSELDPVNETQEVKVENDEGKQQNIWIETNCLKVSCAVCYTQDETKEHDLPVIYCLLC